MKLLALHQRFRKNILRALLAMLSCSAVHAQSSLVAIEGYETIKLDGGISPVGLRTNLESHVLTHLVLSTPEGDKEFTVRPSTHIVSGDKDKAFFEGESRINDADKLFIQIYRNYVMMQYKNTESGKSYMLAKEQDVMQSEMWKHISAHYSFQEATRNKADLALIKSKLLVSSSVTDYVWVKEREAGALVKSIFKEDPKMPRPACHPAPSTEKNLPVPAILHKGTNGSNGPAFDNAGRESSLMGYIGKRDLYVNLYNWDNSVSGYDMGQVISLLPASIAASVDMRFSNIRLVIRQNPIAISSAQLPMNDEGHEFLASFINYVDNHINYSNYNVVNPARFNGRLSLNDYHMLLQPDNIWSYAGIYGILGQGSLPGNYAIAKVWYPTEGYATPLHEFGHNINAIHAPACISGNDDVMTTASFCNQLMYHTDQANKDRIHARAREVANLDEMPPTVTETLPSIVNPNATQDLFEKTNNTTNITLSYPTTTGLTRVSPGALFDGQDFPFGTPFGYGDKITVYLVKLPANGYYQFKITNADYDTYLYLLDAHGNLVAKDDDGVAGTRRSYISGNFNNDWYYVIVGGHWSLSVGTATLKIRYGSSTGGNWKSSANSAGQEGMRLDMGNGNIVYSADFGISNKHTSAVEQLDGESIEVYPNPASANSSVTVNMPHASARTYELYNNIGAKVGQGNLNNAEEKIQLGSLPVGHYYLKVADTLSGKVTTKHFVIM